MKVKKSNPVAEDVKTGVSDGTMRSFPPSGHIIAPAIVPSELAGLGKISDHPSLLDAHSLG